MVCVCFLVKLGDFLLFLVALRCGLGFMLRYFDTCVYWLLYCVFVSFDFGCLMLCYCRLGVRRIWVLVVANCGLVLLSFSWLVCGLCCYIFRFRRLCSGWLLFGVWY